MGKQGCIGLNMTGGSSFFLPWKNLCFEYMDGKTNLKKKH